MDINKSNRKTDQIENKTEFVTVLGRLYICENGSKGKINSKITRNRPTDRPTNKEKIRRRRRRRKNIHQRKTTTTTNGISQSVIEAST